MLIRLKCKVKKKKKQNIQSTILLLEFLWANVTFTSKMTNNWGRNESLVDTEAQVLSVDRVLNFFSVESSLFRESSCFFESIFHRWTSSLNVGSKTTWWASLLTSEWKRCQERAWPSQNGLLNSLETGESLFVDKMWKVLFTKRIYSLFWM